MYIVVILCSHESIVTGYIDDATLSYHSSFRRFDRATIELKTNSQLYNVLLPIKFEPKRPVKHMIKSKLNTRWFSMASSSHTFDATR